MTRVLIISTVSALACGILAMLSAFAEEERAAVSYRELRRALEAGRLSPLVINFARCTPPSAGASLRMTAVVDFPAFNLTDAFVATSSTHLFERSDGTLDLQYLRIRFSPDDTAQVYLRRLDPTSREPRDEGKTYTCALADRAVTLGSRLE